MTHDPRFTHDGRQLTRAAAEADQSTRASNKKWIPQIDDEILALERSMPVKIYNVSRHTWRVSTGLGEYTVQGCPEGQPYSNPIILPAVIHEPVPVDMDKMEYRSSGGKKLALDIIGLGHSISKSRNLTRQGAFIAANDTFDPNNYEAWIKKGTCGTEPTAKEIKRANDAVIADNKLWVQEANALFMQGPSAYGEIGEQHREAKLDLRARGLDMAECGWLYVSQAMDKCPGCQQPLVPGTAKHSCGAVIDWQLARKLRMVSKSEYDEAVLDGIVPGVKPPKEVRA
jgi:hypothetical protein